MKSPLYLDKFFRSVTFYIIFVSLISLLTIILISRFSFFRQSELKSLDFRLTRFSDSEKADTNIVIAAIDQNSLDFFEGQEVSWPWPREFYAVVNDYLSACGARAVIFDIDFSSTEIERNDVDPAISEHRFSESLKNSKNVVIGVNLKNMEKGDQPGNSILEKHRVKSFTYKPVPSFNSASGPLKSLQEGASRLGSINISPDEDGIIRRVPLIFRVRNFYVPQLGFAAYTLFSDAGNEKVQNIIADIPADNNGNYLIKWYGRGGPDGAYQYYSIHSLIVSGYKLQQNMKPDIPVSVFKNKIVIVGGSAVGLMDYKPVPFSSETGFPGMDIHANIINNLLHKDYLYPAPAYITWLVSIIFIILIPIIFF